VRARTRRRGQPARGRGAGLAGAPTRTLPVAAPGHTPQARPASCRTRCPPTCVCRGVRGAPSGARCSASEACKRKASGAPEQCGAGHAAPRRRWLWCHRGAGLRRGPRRRLVQRAERDDEGIRRRGRALWRAAEPLR
jgi:hypothetical protein